jgi:hypothetical protein
VVYRRLAAVGAWAPIPQLTPSLTPSSTTEPAHARRGFCAAMPSRSLTRVKGVPNNDCAIRVLRYETHCDGGGDRVDPDSIALHEVLRSPGETLDPARSGRRGHRAFCGQQVVRNPSGLGFASPSLCAVVDAIPVEPRLRSIARGRGHLSCHTWQAQRPGIAHRCGLCDRDLRAVHRIRLSVPKARFRRPVIPWRSFSRSHEEPPASHPGRGRVPHRDGDHCRRLLAGSRTAVVRYRRMPAVGKRLQPSLPGSRRRAYVRRRGPRWVL